MDKSVPISPDTWLSWLGVALLTFMWFMPRRFRNACAQAIARYSVRRSNGTNRAIDINLQACFPKFDYSVRKAIAERYVALHAQALMSAPRIWFGRKQTIANSMRLHGQENLDQAIQTGQPIVLLITHCAGLDNALISMSTQYPFHGIYNPLKNKVLDYLVYRTRHRFGGRPMPRGSGFRQLIKRLNNGGIMIYLCDEDLGREGSVFAPFFGHQKSTLAMLPRLVKKTNALVVPMIAHHDSDDDAVDVHLFEPLQNYPSDDAVADATTMNEAIAKTIRLQPAQFTWKLRIFQTCPNEQGTRYGQIERGEISVADL